MAHRRYLRFAKISHASSLVLALRMLRSKFTKFLNFQMSYNTRDKIALGMNIHAHMQKKKQNSKRTNSPLTQVLLTCRFHIPGSVFVDLLSRVRQDEPLRLFKIASKPELFIPADLIQVPRQKSKHNKTEFKHRN